MNTLRAPKIPGHHPAVLNSAQEGMEKGAFLFYCQLLGLSTVPQPAQVLIQGAAPHGAEKVQKHFPWGNPQTALSRSIQLSPEQEEIRKRDKEKDKKQWEEKESTEFGCKFRICPDVQSWQWTGICSQFAFPQKVNKSAPALSNHSSFLLPELLPQLSRSCVPCAWLCFSLSSVLVPEPSLCLPACYCESAALSISWFPSSPFLCSVHLLIYLQPLSVLCPSPDLPPAPLSLTAVHRAWDIPGKHRTWSTNWSSVRPVFSGSCCSFY